ncbi:MAG: hypothetical protein M3Q46_00135 [Verrucomicrobiota bacterium]|nr:hypothetical protein [Verrucomicrobiota bacterium]
MIKMTLALLATAVLASSPAFAGDKTCCATKDGKMECAKIYAKLNLTPEQKAKLDSAQETCMDQGCTEESMEKFFAAAKEVLSADQYAQLKMECSKMEKHAEKAGS